MCNLHNNVVKTPAIALEERIKEKHKDVNINISSLLLFYTTVNYCLHYITVYLNLYL